MKKKKKKSEVEWLIGVGYQTPINVDFFYTQNVWRLWVSVYIS